MMRLIVALNAMGSQPVALLVLLIGCGMALASHRYGIESSIASGLIGGGLTLLTHQVSKTISSEPSGSNESTATSQVTETPQASFQEPGETRH